MHSNSNLVHRWLIFLHVVTEIFCLILSYGTHFIKIENFSWNYSELSLERTVTGFALAGESFDRHETRLMLKTMLFCDAQRMNEELGINCSSSLGSSVPHVSSLYTGQCATNQLKYSINRLFHRILSVRFKRLGEINALV